jgi:hypothetical protein
LKKILRQAFDAWLILIKLTVPALVIVRFLLWFDLVGYISLPFEPVMSLMGLPKEMALVWVTGMLINNYAAIVVYFNLLPITGPMTITQATIVGSILLIAHNLPVESSVCRGAGVSPLRITILRIFAAIFYGTLIYHLCKFLSIGNAEAGFVMDFVSDPVPSWGMWLLGMAESLGLIFAVILILLIIIAGMRRIGLITLFSRILGPLMKLSGVGPKATMITIFGMILGLAYGGGLIIAESRSGEIPKVDIYGSITLMAICHSILEDTILLSALGGSLWGLLIGRLAFAVLLTGLIVRAARIPSIQGLLIGRKYT